MSADLTRHHIPIDVEEIKMAPEKEADRITRLELLFDEFREKFSSFMGALKGDDGSGGLLTRLENGMEELKRGQRHADEKLSTIATQAIRDKAETEKALVNQKNQIDNIANMSRSADCKAQQAKTLIETHLKEELEEDREEAGKAVDKYKFNINTLLTVLAVAAAIVIPLIVGG